MTTLPGSSLDGVSNFETKKKTEYEAYTEQLRTSNIEAAEANEARKSLDYQKQNDKQRAEYQDELERK